MPTSVLLLEHAEKIAAAVALRSTVHAEHQTLVDRAIRAALADRENGGRVAAAAAAGTGSNLTPQDHFYCQISRIGDIFSAVLRAQVRVYRFYTLVGFHLRLGFHEFQG